MLFDHGCDALTLTLLNTNICTMFQLGNYSDPGLYDGQLVLVVFLAGSIGFYGATWEEYYVGGLYLPSINGASEGVLLAAIVQIFTGIVGKQPHFEHKLNTVVGTGFWNQVAFSNVRFNHIMVITYVIAGVYASGSK